MICMYYMYNIYDSDIVICMICMYVVRFGVYIGIRYTYACMKYVLIYSSIRSISMCLYTYMEENDMYYIHKYVCTCKYVCMKSIGLYMYASKYMCMCIYIHMNVCM